MKLQDIMAILGVAAVTMAFTLGFAAPDQVGAVDQEENGVTRITPIISQPTLNIAGLDITLTMDKPDYAPGDKPVITLEVTNPTDQRVESNVWIGMTSSSLSSRLSRAPTMPNYLWSKNMPLAFDTGETQQFQFATEKEIVAGYTVSITVSDTDQKEAFANLLNLNAGKRRASNEEPVGTVTGENATAVNSAAAGLDGR
jgi:hypothetical protein